MDLKGKANRIRLLDLSGIPMRTFYLTSMAFMLCFFAWFSIAPLMPIVRDELNLTPNQVGWCGIAAVAATIFGRLLIGRLCDRFGPRKSYAGLMILGALPVMGVGLAQNFESFLIFRLLIGLIGSSFVITQYHTSLMFAPTCVGTANATTAGLGNMGGGVAQIVMPVILSFFVGIIGLSPAIGWRAAMVVAGALCMVMGFVYLRFTQDTPEGNFSELRAAGKLPAGKGGSGLFLEACRDYRVWVLFLIYGGCFGIELTIHNMAAIYFKDQFDLGLTAAGAMVGAFGLLAFIARPLGGWLSDRTYRKFDLGGRSILLGALVLMEGVLLMLFAQASSLVLAAVTLILFGVFVHMACGATYALTPFINRKAMGSVSGIVGAGGNAGAVAAGFLFTTGIHHATALMILGGVVTFSSLLAFTVRFSPQANADIREEMSGREAMPALVTA